MAQTARQEKAQAVQERPPWELSQELERRQKVGGIIPSTQESLPPSSSFSQEPVAAQPAPSFLGAIAEAVPAGFAGALEAFGRAGRVVGIPGSGELVEASKWFGEKFRTPLEGTVGESVRAGVESTITSLLGAVPGIAAGTLAGSAAAPGPGTVIGAFAGYSLGAGVIFSLSEYDRFLEDLSEQGRARGMTDAQIKDLQSEMKDLALISAVAEGGFEAASNALELRFLGFLGKTGLTEGAKAGLKGFLKQWLLGAAKVVPTELVTELATTGVQTETRRAAGLDQPGLGEALTGTVGPVLVQSLLTAGVGTGVQRAIQKPEDEGKIPSTPTSSSVSLSEKAPDTAGMVESDIGRPLESSPDLSGTRNSDLGARTPSSKIHYKFDYSSKADDINSRTWFHGAAVSGLTKESLTPTNSRIDNLFGVGVYLTDNPIIAKSYAKKRKTVKGEKTSSVYEVKVSLSPNAVLDMESPIHPTFQKLLENLAEKAAPFTGVGKEVFSALPEGASNADYYSSYLREIKGTELSWDLEEIFFDFSASLRDAGIQALTHVGGVRVGGLGKHQVLILLPDLNNHGHVSKGIYQDVTEITEATIAKKAEAGDYPQLRFLSPEDIIEENFKERVAWAKTQVDEDDWIKHFEEARDEELAAARGETAAEPAQGRPAVSPNPGQDTNRQLSDEPPVPPTTRMEDTYSKKEREQPFTLLSVLKDLGENIMTPEFYLNVTSGEKISGAIKQVKDGPVRTAKEFVDADLLFHHIVNDHATHYKSLFDGLNEQERKLVTKAMDLVYDIRSTSGPAASKVRAKKQLQDLIAKHPKLARVLRGTDKRGGIIEFFEKIKERVKESKRKTFILNLSPVEFDMFDKAVKLAQPKLENFEQLVNENVDLEAIAQENARKNGRNWERFSADRKQKGIDNARRSEVEKLRKQVQEFKEIDQWGLRDYYTHIELGSWAVLDPNGDARAFAKTEKLANKKARELRQQARQRGESLPPLEVVASVNRVKPMEERRDVGLRGEEDISEVLPRYVYAMEKQIVFNPVFAKYAKDKSQNTQLYDARSVRVLDSMKKTIVGGKPIWVDKVADAVSVAFGWQTGKGSRNLARMRGYAADLKLGYRAVATTVNTMGGFGNTWAALGTEFFLKGRKVLKEGQYTDSAGKIINMDRKIRENSFLLGIDFAIDTDGSIRSRTKIWQPLGIFQLPEKFIRRHSFAANYVYHREVLGMDDFEATENAILNVRFQQNAYNLVSLPKLFRRPDTKTIFQFKTYMVRQTEFLSTLRGKQLARMAGVMLVMGGTRGLIYTLVSLPILGATGALDKMEEWFVKEKGLGWDGLSKGLPGLLGTDITAAAALRYPHTQEDWAGPVLGELWKLYRDVIFPALSKSARAVGGHDEANRPQFVFDDGIDWIGNLPLILGYWNDFLKSVDVNVGVSQKYKWGISVDFGEGSLLERLQRPDFKIHDSEGNYAYSVDGLRDRLLLLSGASPAARSEVGVLRRQWSRDEKIRRDNRRKVLGKAIGIWQKTGDMPKDLQDDLRLYGIRPEAILSRARRSFLDPRQREIMKAELLRKAEALDKFGLE